MGRYYIPPDLVRGPSAMSLSAVQENWGMKVFQIDKLRSITPGGGMIVAVIDTGIDESHPLLAPNFHKAKDFTGSSNGYHDVVEHGTHCCGTFWGIDPALGVGTALRGMMGKALGNDGSGSDDDIIVALKWAASEGAEVISMSLGGGGADPNMEACLKELDDAGIWIICAGGNSGGGTLNTDWPGRSVHAINDAALNQDLSVASFSSAGAKLDTSGPGVGIWSAKPGGGYQQMSGTSMSTPFVAGVLALYRAGLKVAGKPIPKTAELRHKLFVDSTDTGATGVDTRTGPGWITPALLALNLTPDPFPSKP